MILMPVISVRVSNDEKKFLETMAEFKGVSISDLLRTYTFEQLEDEYDARIGEEAYQDYLIDEEAISHEKMMKKHGLTE